MTDRSAPPDLPEGLRHIAALMGDPALFDELTGRLIDAIASRLTDLADDPELRATLEQAARVGVKHLVAQIAQGSSSFILPPETLAVARTLARRGFGTEPLLTGFSSVRQAALLLFNEMSALLPADSEETLPQLVEAWAFILWLADTALEELVAEHGRERDLLVQSRTARRMDLIRDLLSGEQMDTETVSTALGYPLRRHHTAVVGWLVDSGPSTAKWRQTRTTLAAWASAHFQGQVLVVPSGESGAWAWLATSTEPDTRLFLDNPLPEGAGLAVGSTGYGAQGFRRSHEEAMLTQRIVRARDKAEGFFSLRRHRTRGAGGGQPDRNGGLDSEGVARPCRRRARYSQASRNPAGLLHGQPAVRSRRRCSRRPQEHRALSTPAGRRTLGPPSG